jgi:Mycobacterium membrane protein
LYGWHWAWVVGVIRLAKKVWIPVVIVIVVAIAGFTVHRIRTFFGAEGIIVTPRVFADDPEPFDPKVVTYEIFGSGSYADINYLDLDAKPQRVDGAALPWSLTLQTTAPSAAPNIVAQGDGGTITCRITVDDEVKDERTSSGVNAQTFCFVKSA